MRAGTSTRGADDGGEGGTVGNAEALVFQVLR